MIGFTLPWIYAHLIGDYLIQNDWMALNKKKNSWICLVHVLTYMIPFLFTSINPLGLFLIAAQHYIPVGLCACGGFRADFLSERQRKSSESRHSQKAHTPP